MLQGGEFSKMVIFSYKEFGKCSYQLGNYGCILNFIIMKEVESVLG